MDRNQFHSSGGTRLLPAGCARPSAYDRRRQPTSPTRTAITQAAVRRNLFNDRNARTLATPFQGGLVSNYSRILNPPQGDPKEADGTQIALRVAKQKTEDLLQGGVQE